MRLLFQLERLAISAALFLDGLLGLDCVASIRRWDARDALGQTLMQRTDELGALDDRTIRFRLPRLFPLLPDALGKGVPDMCAIMPERPASTDPYNQVTDRIGSGPYRLRANKRVQERSTARQSCSAAAPSGAPDMPPSPN